MTWPAPARTSTRSLSAVSSSPSLLGHQRGQPALLVVAAGDPVERVLDPVGGDGGERAEAAAGDPDAPGGRAARRRAARRAWCRRRRARARGRTRRLRRAARPPAPGPASAAGPPRSPAAPPTREWWRGRCSARAAGARRGRCGRRGPPDMARDGTVVDRHVLRVRRLAARPAGRHRADRRRRGGRAARAGVGRRHALLRRAGGVARAARARGGHPPGRPRPLPVLLGAGRALRRRRPPRDRDRLLRPHRRARPARGGLRVHAARAEDAAARPCRTTPRRRSPRCASAPARARASTRRLLLRRHAVVPRGDERRARPRGRGRLLRLAEPGALGRHVADPPRRRHARARAGAVRRRRRGHPARPGRGVRRSLAEAGVEHEIVTYPGAPHSFFDRRYEEHAEACADAWRRLLAFL